MEEIVDVEVYRICYAYRHYHGILCVHAAQFGSCPGTAAAGRSGDDPGMMAPLKRPSWHLRES